LGHETKRVLAFSTGSAVSRQDTPVGRASVSSASAAMDKDFIISAADILQVLLCLSNLMRAEADNPGKVRVCANLAEEKLLALGELMRPMLWNPA
jgi:hypothetical protein